MCTTFCSGSHAPVASLCKCHCKTKSNALQGKNTHWLFGRSIPSGFSLQNLFSLSVSHTAKYRSLKYAWIQIFSFRLNSKPCEIQGKYSWMWGCVSEKRFVGLMCCCSCFFLLQVLHMRGIMQHNTKDFRYLLFCYDGSLKRTDFALYICKMGVAARK